MRISKYSYYLRSILKLITEFDKPLLMIQVFTGSYRKSPYNIRLRQSGLSLAVRGATDIWSVKETFLDRFYERCGMAVQDSWNVIDIGAGIGDYAILAGFGHPKNRVFAYEPFEESFMLMKKNLETNQITNVTPFKEAVAGKSGFITLDLSQGDALKIKSRVSEGESSSAAGSVLCLSLEEVLSRSGLAGCDLLKMDCEGAEYEILFNTPAAVLKTIRRIVMEYHDGVTNYSHTDLSAYLIQNGFKVQIIPNDVHAEIGYLYAQVLP